LIDTTVSYTEQASVARLWTHSTGRSDVRAVLLTMVQTLPTQIRLSTAMFPLQPQP
jgi:hypothetical protein